MDGEKGELRGVWLSYEPDERSMHRLDALRRHSDTKYTVHAGPDVHEALHSKFFSDHKNLYVHLAAKREMGFELKGDYDQLARHQREVLEWMGNRRPPPKDGGIVENLQTEDEHIAKALSRDRDRQVSRFERWLPTSAFVGIARPSLADLFYEIDQLDRDGGARERRSLVRRFYLSLTLSLIAFAYHSVLNRLTKGVTKRKS